MQQVSTCKRAESRSTDAISKVRVHVFVRLITNQPGVRSWTFKSFQLFKAAAVSASWPDHSFDLVLLLEFFHRILASEFYDPLFEIGGNQLLVANGATHRLQADRRNRDISTPGGLPFPFNPNYTF
ncbi:hypothetical protein AMECASPLE_039706 [Ameca splendens]|uniref:Uncharacterized protein n=1 Tax=Ameca splendens TaxID=208324 RepID=A0ABV0Z6Q6_9TELE